MSQNQNLPDPSPENTSFDDSRENSNVIQHDKSSSSQDQHTGKNIKKTLVTVTIFLLLALIAFGLWKAYQPKEVELQGRVEAETLHVSTKVPSRIEEVLVQEGESVRKGQVLVRLYSPEVDAKKQQALASLQSALALQSTTERGAQEENISSLYANWQALKAQEALARTTDQRSSNLYKEGVISRQRKDEIHAAAISASEMTEAAYQQYARAQRGSTPQQKTSADAQVEIAKAAVAEANALEAETTLISPIDGIVSKTYGKTSELVASGVPVVTLIDQGFWISLNVREDQYANIYKEQFLDGFVPALNKTIQFEIKNIDAEGDFATIKTTRQTGGYDIRSFKLKLYPHKFNPDLKVGMSVLFKIKENN